jgi:hypothetical protein
VLVRLGLHRCHCWSHILIYQHLTLTSVWPNCGFTLQSLANPSQAAPRSHRRRLEVRGGLNFFQLSCKYTTDVSICKVETDSAIIAEPPKSQDGKRALLLPELSRVGPSTARNRIYVTCKAYFFPRALLLRGRPSVLVRALCLF